MINKSAGKSGEAKKSISPSSAEMFPNIISKYVYFYYALDGCVWNFICFFYSSNQTQKCFLLSSGVPLISPFF